MKNEIILPYEKTITNFNANASENKIIISQEDLNELYDEDPDGDLDF